MDVVTQKFSSIELSAVHTLVNADIPLSKNPLIFGGYSLLKLAIKMRNRKEIVKLLIKKGARVNKKYCDKSAPLLHIAIKQQHLDIVKLLVKKGANVNEPHRHKLTAMLVTVVSLKKLSIDSPSINIMKFLIKSRADIQAKDKNGGTARNWSGKKLDEKCNRTIYSKPINNFWELSYYKYLVKYISYNLYKCIIAMKEHRIGTSTISFFHLWTAPWNQLINHAYNKDVRELCISDYADKYPLFTCMIQKRFNGAVKRSKLLEKFTEKFFFLLKTLPFLCCQTILTYFDDDDLELFNILTYLYYSVLYFFSHILYTHIKMILSTILSQSFLTKISCCVNVGTLHVIIIRNSYSFPLHSIIYIC
uniref:Hypothetical ankyrin repeat protein WSPANK n=1 Tax=Cotesia congregata TaxID=51543 RepID=S6CVW9_COTCN|nr:hypothetical ankyrin repeat protein WSPANK [Cotesia congregata]